MVDSMDILSGFGNLVIFIEVILAILFILALIGFSIYGLLFL